MKPEAKGWSRVEDSQMSLNDFTDSCDAVVSAMSIGLLLLRSLGNFDCLI